MYITWTGSDVMFLNENPPHYPKYKIFYRLVLKAWAWIGDRSGLITKHVVTSEHLIKELKKGLKTKLPIEVRPSEIKPIAYKKPRNARFTVGYYSPLPKKTFGWQRSYLDWLYGKDIISGIQTQFQFNKIQFYPLYSEVDFKNWINSIDCYIRPNRHDGQSRLSMACESYGIPYLESKHDPVYGDFAKFIHKQFNIWLSGLDS